MKKKLIIYINFLNLIRIVFPMSVFAAGPHGSCGKDFIDSAIGCIPINNTVALAEFLLRWGIGIASGISFLLILYSGFLLMTSTGDPKRIQAGRELMTSAVGGLIFLVFSVFILRLVGVDILHIPGFGE